MRILAGKQRIKLNTYQYLICWQRVNAYVKHRNKQKNFFEKLKINPSHKN